MIPEKVLEGLSENEKFLVERVLTHLETMSDDLRVLILRQFCSRCHKLLYGASCHECNDY